MNVQCLQCKGRGLCGRAFCPHIAKAQAIFRVTKRIGSAEFSGSSPAPFVGRFGYPYVNVGILSPPERAPDAWRYDAPKHWSGENYTIPQIIDLRSSLVNSRFNANIKDHNRFLEISKEIGMAAKPVDVEIKLEDKPQFRINPSAETAPMGPNARLKSADITSNPSVHTKVDKVVSDTDLRAADALAYLHSHSFDENFLTRLFSVGNLGIEKNRKLVPTRWSITAVDDTLGKHLHSEIVQFESIDEHQAFFGSYLGNYYLIMLLPDIWSYELFETYMPKASWNTASEVSVMTDFEPYAGRKDYAENCVGGYYSVRLAVLEKLKGMRRQATCLVIRVITGEYAAPLGVWVTREAARKALLGKPLRFASLELMQSYTRALIRKKFGFDADTILRQSEILKLNKSQTKLDRFL
jgi:DNA repair protein NreA